MKSAVLASSNPHKLVEIAALLGRPGRPGFAGLAGFALRPQSDFGLQTPPETGADFAENALLKAGYVCERTGLAALADDSGLEVEALGGEPGVYSARYAGPGASDADNLNKLLERITPFPEDRLAARFRCAAAYVEPGIESGNAADTGEPIVVEAVWRGRLVKSPRGDGGFGYDPVFFVEEYGCTAAELALETKNRISHRAQAFRRLCDAIAARSTQVDGAEALP